MNNNESDLQTYVFYRKPYTGLLLNYSSFVPNCYKLWWTECIGLIVPEQVLTKKLRILKIFFRKISTLLK